MAYDEELANRIREVLAGVEAVSEKAMFGGLAFLIEGHMAVAASREGGLLLRIDPAASDELIAHPHAERAVMRGRAMAGWLRIDAAGVASDEDLEHWVRIGVQYVHRLPPTSLARR